ncbi:MAG: hypothetical protein ACOVN5_07180 [Aquidulcibacter sp.]
MLTTFILPVTRHVMTAAGAALVSKGYLDGAGVELLTGAVINIVSLGWMFYAKKSGKA